MGWSRIPWKDAATFDEAITAIAESSVFKEDAFSPDDCVGITPDEWGDLLAKRHLDLEDGFFLATGVRVSGAVFRFKWGDDVFFNMRPDFGFMCLATDLGEQPINAAESKFRDRLLDFYRETDAMKRAIEAEELDPMKTYTVEWWRYFWKVRGISVPDEPETAEKPTEKPLQPRERTTLLNTIAALLGYIAGETPGVEKHPSFESEAKLIEAIAEHYKGYDGLSQSNLSRKFPEAKRSLQFR
jgi:hypothetical protein